MVQVEIVRELSGFRGPAVLVKRDADYFIVSSVTAYSGPETLVFRADESGEVTSWTDVAGGRDRSRAEVIAQLERGEDRA